MQECCDCQGNVREFHGVLGVVTLFVGYKFRVHSVLEKSLKMLDF